MKTNSKLAIIAVFLIFLAIGAVIAFIYKDLPTTGIVKTENLSLTWASDETQVTSIDWGVTSNGIVYTLEPIKITNIGNVPIVLNLYYFDRSPNIQTLTLGWNYVNGTIIQPNDFVVVQLTQTITAPQGETYTYTTSITGTEAT